MGAGRTAGRGLPLLPAQGLHPGRGPQTPLMPRRMDAPPTLPRSVGAPALRGWFPAQGFGSCGSPRIGGLTPSSSVLGCREHPKCPHFGGGHSCTPHPSGLPFHCPPCGDPGGGLGVAGGLASLPTSLQIPAASTDTLLTGTDWLGLAEGSPKRGHCQAAGGVAWGQGPSSQQQILCTVFSIPVFE